MDVHSYLDAIKLKLAASRVVKVVDILQERASFDSGFFRARLILENSDFVEVTEYFVITAEEVQTIEYRHQWMDSTRTVLRRRWDNAEHHRGLANFPHHIHVGDETTVQPGRPLSIIGIVGIIERDMADADV